jgi:phosphoadenosine phosphosulfate reductase
MSVNLRETKELLQHHFAEHGEKMAFSTSFSLEDQIITHLLVELNLPVRVFTLDTGRLFSETYSVMERTRQRYNLSVEVYSPQHEPLQELLAQKGWFSFYESVENRKECCAIRKVEPLNRALKGVSCWVTGIRAAHSENREDMTIVETDHQRGLLKLNPLLHWSTDEVMDYIRTEQIPYNVLHDKGFISIGCQPCTRAIAEGEDFRAGRWWWEDNSKKECGLHTR